MFFQCFQFLLEFFKVGISSELIRPQVKRVYFSRGPLEGLLFFKFQSFPFFHLVGNTEHFEGFKKGGPLGAPLKYLYSFINPL
jgi:hypothetical protein